MADLANEIAGMFAPGYWTVIAKELGHNFFDTHLERTYEYDRRFIQDLKGKKVLEVGSYPGLLTAFLLYRGANVTVLDSPIYNSDIYRDFLKSKDVNQIVHDIVAGAPKLKGKRHWEAAIMSDVLLHIEGFPYDFIEWLLNHCDRLYFINYQSSETMAVPAKHHNLHTGYTILGEEAVAKWAEGLGFKVESSEGISDRRMLVIISRKKDE